MMSLLLMWFLFIQLNANPLWIGAGVAMTFFYGRAAYRNWREQRMMAHIVNAAAEAMAKKASESPQEAAGDEKPDSKG